MSKNTKLIKEKARAQRKLAEKIEEKKKDRELFLSNRATQRLTNRLSGATYRKPKEE